MRRLRSLVCTITVAFAGTSFAQAPPAQMVMRFTTSRVQVEGRPGADLALMGVGHVPDGFQSQLFKWAGILADADRDAKHEFDPGRKVPRKSLWVAVDIQTTDFVIASPKASLPRSEFGLPPLRRGPTGILDQFEAHVPFVQLLYVEQGKGAWIFESMDGGPFDENGKSDGVVRVSVRSARPLVSGMPPPTEFKSGGVLVLIDSYMMRVYAARIDGSLVSTSRDFVLEVR